MRIDRLKTATKFLPHFFKAFAKTIYNALKTSNVLIKFFVASLSEAVLLKHIAVQCDCIFRLKNIFF